MTILLTQLVVVGGLTALSVRGARDARALAGKPIELIEQNGQLELRIAGEETPSVGEAKAATIDINGTATNQGSHGHVTESQPRGGSHSDVVGPGAETGDAEHWLAELESRLDTHENAKLAKMKAGKTPQQVRDILGGDLNAARARVRTEVRLEQERAAVATQSKQRVAELRKQIAERGLMDDPEIREIIDGRVTKNAGAKLSIFRDKLVAKILRAETESAHPGAEVLDSIHVYEKLPEANMREWKTKNPGKKGDGLTERPEGLYIQRGEIDMMAVERQPSGKAKVVAREEIKTGGRDTNAEARGQLNDQTSLLADAAAGKKSLRLEVGGHDITGEIDLGSDAAARKSTRGPAGKGFEKSLGVSATDLETLCKELLAEVVSTRGTQP